MYKIGDMARVCKTSIKTLRMYEQKNILLPKKIDHDTGYRFYEDEQVNTFLYIKMLQYNGCSLDEISKIVDGKLSYKAIIEDKLDRVEKEIDILEQKRINLNKLNKNVESINEATFLNYDLNFKVIECEQIYLKKDLDGKFLIFPNINNINEIISCSITSNAEAEFIFEEGTYISGYCTYELVQNKINQLLEWTFENQYQIISAPYIYEINKNIYEINIHVLKAGIFSLKGE